MPAKTPSMCAHSVAVANMGETDIQGDLNEHPAPPVHAARNDQDPALEQPMVVSSNTTRGCELPLLGRFWSAADQTLPAAPLQHATETEMPVETAPVPAAAACDGSHDIDARESIPDDNAPSMPSATPTDELSELLTKEAHSGLVGDIGWYDAMRVNRLLKVADGIRRPIFGCDQPAQPTMKSKKSFRSKFSLLNVSVSGLLSVPLSLSLSL